MLDIRPRPLMVPSGKHRRSAPIDIIVPDDDGISRSAVAKIRGYIDTGLICIRIELQPATLHHDIVRRIDLHTIGMGATPAGRRAHITFRDGRA